MTAAIVRVRARSRSDTLERIGGLLRRRAFAVTRVSWGMLAGGDTEVLIRIDTARTDVERVCRELRTLYDVTHVVCEPQTDAQTREMMRVRLTSEGAAETLDVIGSPRGIDALLAALHQHRAMAGYVRTGELALPSPTTETPGDRGET